MESERLQNISQGINEAAQRGIMVQLTPLTARELLDHIEAQKRVIDVLQAANMQQATTVREALNRAETAERKLNDTLPQYVAQCAALLERTEAAEARIRELEAQIAGLLPAAQALVTSIEFIPIPASNAAADSALLTGTGETSGGNAHGPVKSAMLP